MSTMPAPRDLFRRACSRFATGVAVATAVDPAGQPHGLTVNSFTSVSAEPPLVLICIDRSSSLLPLFESASSYGLCFLSESQRETSARFAMFPEGRFQGVKWQPGTALGVPILDGCIGWMECAIHQRILAGDHVILLAQVERCHAEEGRPLLYFGSDYRQLAELAGNR